MKRHPEGTEKLIDTRDERRKGREARIQQDQTIMHAIRRDQRKKAQNGEQQASARHRQVA